MSASQTPATATPISSARKSRATRSAEKNAAAAKSPETTQPTAAETSAPKAAAPKVEHQITIDLGLIQTPTWKPTAVVDGETVACGHTRYGHESEVAAKRCIAAVVRAATS